MSLEEMLTKAGEMITTAEKKQKNKFEWKTGNVCIHSLPEGNKTLTLHFLHPERGPEPSAVLENGYCPARQTR